MKNHKKIEPNKIYKKKIEYIELSTKKKKKREYMK